jgi:hypothetical protein
MKEADKRGFFLRGFLSYNLSEGGFNKGYMVTKDLRSHERNPFVESLEYSVTVENLKRLRKINEVAVAIDLSKKGIGILINHPLEAGHVLTFKNNRKAHIPLATTAIVKWSDRIDDTTYRAGLKFT